MTSLASMITFVILSLHTPGAVAPDFDDGIALGIGGLVGGYTGARLQSRIPSAATPAGSKALDRNNLRSGQS